MIQLLKTTRTQLMEQEDVEQVFRAFTPHVPVSLLQEGILYAIKE